MTTTTTTNFGIPIPPLSTGGTTDGYATLMQTADTAIKNASGLGAWTSYTGVGESTIVGWSVFTTKVIKYKKVGNTVFVIFAIEGTSDSADVSFTLPNSVGNNTYGTVAQVSDSGSASATPGYLVMILAFPTTVSIYLNSTGAPFTATGTKKVRGQFFYEVA